MKPVAAASAPGLVPALVIGSVGLLVLGVQPLLYAGYVHADGLDVEGLGRLAALEIAMLSIGCAVGIGLLKRVPAAALVAAGVAFVAAGNLGAQFWLFAARATAGLGGGLMVAVAASTIARRAHVDRLAAAFLFLQAATQFIVLTLASQSTGDATRFAERLLIAAGLLVLPLALYLPADLRQPPLAAGQDASRPSPLGLLGLAVSAHFVGAVVGIWAYLGLWLETFGLPADAIARLLTISLAGQMAGALGAMALARGGRSSSRALMAGTLLLAVLAGLALLSTALPLKALLLFGFGAAWMVATPALTGVLEELDPARGSLPFAASAQLMGAAMLPPLVGTLAGDGDVARIIASFAIAVLLSLVMLAMARLIRDQS